MSSWYWVQPEYPPHADVVNTAARLMPSTRIRSTVSSTYGSQLRLPKYTGTSTFRCAISASICSIRARLIPLIGEIPPKWR